MIPNRPVYLDNQATTPCDPRVLNAMLPYFTEKFGNPHSTHGMGQEAEAAVERAREQVAALIGADAREIIFTSGATESNNLAIKGLARHALRRGLDRRRVITCTTEHKCVLEAVRDLAAEGFEPVILSVQSDGRLDPDQLRAALQTPTLLVSVMAVNNETGVIQDVAAIAALAHEAGAAFHTDAAQATGKIALHAERDGLDLISISGHKLYAPKGVGALRVRHRPRLRLEPLLSGGGQERGLRSGTLPPPLIVALGEACRIAGEEMEAEAERLLPLRDRLLTGLRARIPQVEVNGSMEHRIPGNLNAVFPREGLAIMAACPDLCISSGSACTSGLTAASHVLLGLGLKDETARRCLRLGLGRFTSEADVDFAIDALAKAVRSRGIPRRAAEAAG
jgi:cysteine desulfurase